MVGLVGPSVAGTTVMAQEMDWVGILRTYVPYQAFDERTWAASLLV